MGQYMAAKEHIWQLYGSVNVSQGVLICISVEEHISVRSICQLRRICQLRSLMGSFVSIHVGGSGASGVASTVLLALRHRLRRDHVLSTYRKWLGNICTDTWGLYTCGQTLYYTKSAHASIFGSRKTCNVR
jgi:hypothetical protein